MTFENPYEWDTGKLLNEFMNACAQAGTSNSGLVISFSAGSDLDRAHYLRGVVRARIDGKTPPVKPGDKVRPKDGLTKPSPSNGWDRSSNPRKLPKSLTIKQIFYMASWEVVFAENSDATADTDGEYYQDGGREWHVPLRFKIDDFEVIEEVKA